jgi:hypothetical protein
MNNTQTEPKTLLRLRWKINGVEGHGVTVSVALRESLEAWCAIGNHEFGPGSHWIEEVDV